MIEQNAASAIADLKKNASPSKARVLQRFFKTGKGEYGEGDIFLGVTVPEQRVIARKYASFPLGEIKKLLESQLHECRLTALLILVGQYARAERAEKKKIVDFYLRNRRRVNNWDLVDSSACHILGDFLKNDSSCEILFTLTRSKFLWGRRIAIVSTLAMIRARRFDMTIRIAELLLDDAHDLIHKAVGWMLREMGKQNESELTRFVRAYKAQMPRTMLRYAIERYPEKIRKQLLASH